MLAKILDAVSMGWESLDTQERLILCYLLAIPVVLVLTRDAERRKEERLAQRVAMMVREGTV